MITDTTKTTGVETDILSLRKAGRNLVKTWEQMQTPEYFFANPSVYSSKYAQTRHTIDVMCNEFVRLEKSIPHPLVGHPTEQKYAIALNHSLENLRHELGEFKRHVEAQGFYSVPLGQWTDVKMMEECYQAAQEAGISQWKRQWLLRRATGMLKKSSFGDEAPSNLFDPEGSMKSDGKGSLSLPILTKLLFWVAGLTVVALAAWKSSLGNENPQTHVDSSVSGTTTALPLIGMIALASLLTVGAFFALLWWKRVRSRRAEKTRREQGEVIRRDQTWARVLAEGDNIVALWAQRSTDLGYVLTNPMIANVNEPSVSKVIGLIQEFRRFRQDSTPTGTGDPWDTRLGVVVRALDHAVEDLFRQAAVLKDANYSPEERKKLKQAQQLLSVALDSGGNINERALAYAKLRSVVEELSLYVSPETFVRMELDMENRKALSNA